MSVKLSEVGDEDLYPDRPDELDDEFGDWDKDEWEEDGDMDDIGDID